MENAEHLEDDHPPEFPTANDDEDAGVADNGDNPPL
jgi:hypothetical protein